jgi:glutaredoxin
MKFVIRFFFKTLRLALGPVLLLWEMLTHPKALVRTPARQAEVDQACQNIVLYQFKTCPFCMKVRQELRRLSLPIHRLDAQKDPKNRADLLSGCGKTKVPCLKITDQAGNSQWMTDSAAIVTYLRGRFAPV